MKPITNFIQLFVTVGIALFASETAVFAASDVHKEIGYVVSSGEDTPSKQGLLPIAFKESLVAAAHASYSENSAGNHRAMKTHVGHVRHAIDPTLEAGGPGMGYGLLKAIRGAIEHMTLASELASASEAVKTHSVHVLRALNNALERTNLALIEADAIMAAANADDALPHAVEMAKLTKAAFAGVDANGDGKISWEKGEGGLQVADKHMGYILDAEGLKR